MILYTMMPPELVYPYESDAYQKYRTINHLGVPVLIESVSDDSAHIVRVLSSDPQHFLDDRFTPGTKISFMNDGGLSAF